MGYRLERDEPVPDGVRRIAAEQVAKAADELRDRELDAAETVHQVRKRCKKVRGLLRLVRPAAKAAYAEENAAFRDAARLLSGERDATALLEAHDELAEALGGRLDPDVAATVRDVLLRPRRDDAATPERSPDELLAAFAERLERAGERIPGWRIDARGYDAIRGGLVKTYRRGRSAMREAFAERDAARFHDWRKRVKYHGYHLRLLRPLWPKGVQGARKGAEELGSLLGDEHDLTVLDERLTAAREGPSAPAAAIDVYLARLRERREELRSDARRLGACVFAERPRALERRFGAYFEAARG